MLMKEFMGAFPPSPVIALTLLTKLDLAFASLLTGLNAETGQPLPGFEKERGVSMTEKVRMRSIVESSKLVAVKFMGADYRMGYNLTDDDDDDLTDTEWEPATPSVVSDIDMRIAKVYQRTIELLSNELDTSPVGMIIND
jgi:hypothetical protein